MGSLDVAIRMAASWWTCKPDQFQPPVSLGTTSGPRYDMPRRVTPVVAAEPDLKWSIRGHLVEQHPSSSRLEAAKPGGSRASRQSRR